MKKNIVYAVLLILMAGCAANNTDNMNKDFLTLATERYSVRSFADTPVAQDTIDLILKAGQVAPTAINSQPQKIYVVKSPEAMARMRTLTPCTYGAPQCFIFCYNDDTVCRRGENGNYGEIDVTIVLTHMMLQAAELGIGTCPVGYFNPEELKKEMGLPSNVHPILLMPFGYAAADAAPSPRHSEYRPLTETVDYL